MRKRPLAAALATITISIGLVGCTTTPSNPRNFSLCNLPPTRIAGSPPAQPKVEDLVTAKCTTFWASPGQVLTTTLKGKWYIEPETAVTVTKSKPTEVGFKIKGKAISVTLPEIATNTNDNQFDPDERRIDHTGTNRSPLFIPATDGNNGMSGAELEVAVKPTPPHQLADYIYPQTVNQLRVGQTGYVSNTYVNRYGEDGKRGIMVFSGTIYRDTANTVAPVRVTRRSNGLTVCVPEGTPIDVDATITPPERGWLTATSAC